MTKLDRSAAINLLYQYVKNEKMVFHCLASEAVMQGLARKLGRDEESWGLAGLLHDLDVEITNAEASVHGTQTEILLKDYDVGPDILDAIRMHNECSSGKERSTEFQHALAAGETITGLIFATTYVYPEKKLAVVKPKSVVKRMKEKMFAACPPDHHFESINHTSAPIPAAPNSSSRTLTLSNVSLAEW